ncbi:MAG: hypothetical protein KDD19_26025 [Phaeodactylibacter sp.]|nr:hypothetical protein [Phaeodactylibacter sp.]MCB9051300.1 hypothetical protein [Lewinellaceae bacterium]
MRYKNLIFSLAVSFMAAGALLVSGCNNDDEQPVDAPSVSLSASTFSGKIGETATTTATVTAPGGLKALRVTKYLGTDIDPTYGTNGTMEVTSSTFTLEYTLADEGLETPIRFNFEAEDDKGQTGDADFIITTELSMKYLLLNFNWQWKSKMGKCLDSEPESEMILDCELDNIYIFNEDGTMGIDYGAITGTGGGTCDFDGLKPPTTWEMNDDETELTITSVNVFDPADVQVELYRITSFDAMEINSEQTVDLTVFGCVIWDWKFTWSAVPK